jgi:hypothetical protein
MNLPKRLLTQYLGRFDELIVEGEAVLGSFRQHVERSPFGMGHSTYEHWVCEDEGRLNKWETNILNLVQPFIQGGTKLKEQVDQLADLGKGRDGVRMFVSVLKALREDLERGFLDDLLLKVEAEVAADYMGQAEELLGEGQPGKFDHVPAAVLAGAVLEKALRRLCEEHQSPISTIDANGKPKTLHPLVEELKKANVFNEVKATQLRSWAAIRNKAAHGEFDQFKRTDVEQMIRGVQSFLADYLS